MRRELKNFRWDFSNKKITILDKRGITHSVTLDKIGFMSLARFILSAQDRLRLDDLKVVKGKLNSLKDKYRKKHANHTAVNDRKKATTCPVGTIEEPKPSPEYKETIHTADPLEV